MVFSFPGSGQGSPGWCGGSVFGRACLIAGGCHSRLQDRSAVLPACPLGYGVWVFIAACAGRMVLCSGLLCVRFCGAGRGKKSVSSVFSCSPGTTGHSAGAGWLDFSWVWVQPGKSPVWCWTGKSDCGWVLGSGFFLCSPGVSAGPCPAYLARELAEAVGVFCGVGKKSNRIEQNF